MADVDMTTSPPGLVVMSPYVNPQIVQRHLTHAKCLLVLYDTFRYANSQTHNFFKTVYSTLSHGWPNADMTCWCLLWCFCFELRARANRCHNHLSAKILSHYDKQGQLYCRKNHKRNKMWLCDHVLRTNGVEASQVWVILVHFSI